MTRRRLRCARGWHGSVLGAALAVTAGCDRFAEGEIVVSVDSQQVARDGLGTDPEDDGAQAFVDGWEVVFSRALVSIGELKVGESGGETAAYSRAYYLVDLTRGEPDIEHLESLGAQRWDAVSFTVQAPPQEATVKTFGATDVDVAAMRDGGYGYWIEGSATRDDRTVTFAWGIPGGVELSACVNGVDDRSGVFVTKNETASLEITVHLQHLLWDTLGAERGRLRFDAVAAVADADGVVSWGALAQQNLADLRDANGDPLVDANGPVVYDARSVELPRDDLQQFILASMGDQPHLGGTGACKTQAN